MKTPLTSVITPAYKAENTIKRAVSSMLKQDFSDWEEILKTKMQDDNFLG